MGVLRPRSDTSLSYIYRRYIKGLVTCDHAKLKLEITAAQVLELIEEMLAGVGLERRPWSYESPSRQRSKFLPFRKLQPPRNFRGFYIAFHLLHSVVRQVLLILDTNWPQKSEVNPSS